MEAKSINDFSKGSMWKNILKTAIPYTVAQMVQLMYNLVDRIYIGHMKNESGFTLTGIGLALPIVSIISAFSLLYSSGGAPLLSIARGKNDHKKAEKLLGNCFSLIIITGIILMFIFYIFMRPILFALGASDFTYGYAKDYLNIYLLGTVFTMVAAGMNMFINAQGFSKIGMASIIVGAVSNIFLDPIFIFYFDMGIKGAAIATVISQILSATWVVGFLLGKKTIYKIKLSYMWIDDIKLLMQIIGLGISGFTMAVTNSITQMACNAMLQKYGGDSYVGSMTILNSVREVFTLIGQGLALGAQPVIGFNFGAGLYDRVKKGIKFICILVISYMFIAWLLVDIYPDETIGLFTHDKALIELSIPALKIFFMGFFMMGFQFCAQSIFVALGYSKQAVFFSLFRKVIIVLPLTIYLPVIMGVNGVFYAEPISNYIGGLASFTVMSIIVFRRLSNKPKYI